MDTCFCLFSGGLFLSNDAPVWNGFVMLMVTPCTDWYLVFTGIAKGNVALSTSILPANLIFQVLFLPIYLLLFFGESGNVALSSLVHSIVVVLVIPFVLALIVKNKKGSIPFFEQSQVLFLTLAIAAIFASEGKNLLPHF